MCEILEMVNIFIYSTIFYFTFFYAEVVMMGHVESWTNSEVFAAHLLNQR